MTRKDRANNVSEIGISSAIEHRVVVRKTMHYATDLALSDCVSNDCF
jgi:hypothetical protein